MLQEEEESKMNKLTFEEVMDRYEGIINGEFEFPYFSSYYITDNNCNGIKEKPYKLECLCVVPFAPDSKNENNKYVLSEEQKQIYKNRLIETFNKKNIYSF